MTSSWWFYRQFAMPETSENWPGLVDSCVYYAHQTPDPANWRSRRVTVCFTCARNIVSAHKINFCVDVRMVCFPCVWLCFICVSFEFTLGSCVFNLSLRCYWARGKLKMVSNQHIVNTKNHEDTLAPICLASLPYSLDFKAPGELWNPLSKTVNVD